MSTTSANPTISPLAGSEAWPASSTGGAALQISTAQISAFVQSQIGSGVGTQADTGTPLVFSNAIVGQFSDGSTITFSS